MNRKSKRNLIVLLALIVILLLVFLFLKKNEDADFMQEEVSTEEESVSVVSIQAEEITDIAVVRNDGDSFTLHKDGDTWSYLEDTEEAVTEKITAEDGDGDTVGEGTEDTSEAEAEETGKEASDTTRKVDQDTVSTYLENVCALTAKQEIMDVTDMSEYGISEKSDSVTLQLDNNLYVFRIGDYNSLAEGYYLTVNDGDSVYLIDSSTYYLMYKDSSYFEDTSEEEDTEESTE